MAFVAAYYRALRPNLARQAATALLLLAGVGFFPCDAGCVDVTTAGRLDAWFSMRVRSGTRRRWSTASSADARRDVVLRARWSPVPSG